MLRKENEEKLIKKQNEINVLKIVKRKILSD